MDYSELDEYDDSDVIDYDEVTKYAKAGLKNPVMIAHAMQYPVKWFTDTHKEKVDLAIERGLAFLVLETTSQIRKNAEQGDFQAQKYILQNTDDTWSDRKEVVNRNEIDIKGLPNLRELLTSNATPKIEKAEKEINPVVIEGEVVEVKKKL